jgi:uncharacterized protein YecE (DUF72 family)
MKKNSINNLIGCSGYHYPQWKDKFYPAKLPSSSWLEYYSSVFNTVELNSTFYRLPKLRDLERYYNNTSESFKFSVKASRYITHILRLKESAQQIEDFIGLIQTGLTDKFNKILFQLPPSFLFSADNLDLVLKNIPHSPNNVIEFRHNSWWNKEVETAFKKASYTFCNVDYPGIQNDFIHTSDHFYLRLHGVPQLFKSAYTSAQLSDFLDRTPSDSISSNIYFNNTYYDAAWLNALEMTQLFKNEKKLIEK